MMRIYPLLGAALLFAGCATQDPESATPTEPTAVPVEVDLLRRSAPGQNRRITGSVASWKTEQIGFEVPGRVVAVVELNEMVEGEIPGGPDKAPIQQGTPIARLDPERYQIAVESAQAAVAVAERQRDAVQVDLEQRLPANIDAARAEQALADLEASRIERLVERGAGNQADLDQARTKAATAAASVAAAEAQQASRAAELRSAEASVLQATQRLKDAQRDLEKTTLYSSFRGQVAEVLVLPGSVVSAGSPVVTVQLMDPLAVEFEVSAAEVRNYRYGDTLKVVVTDPNGTMRELGGLVYVTDAVADPQTRTFTIKLLVRNDPAPLAPPEDWGDAPVVRTTDIWPLNVGRVLDGELRPLVEERSIHYEGDTAYVWKITNRRMNQPTTSAERTLNVTRVPVIPDPEIRIPFLGNWRFVPVTFPNEADFNVNHDVIAGPLQLPADYEGLFNGDQILLDRGGFVLRPGDLVDVELARVQAPEGFWVPMRCLKRGADSTSLFIVENTGEKELVVRELPVRLDSSDPVMIENEALFSVTAIGDVDLEDGMTIVTGGVHYLRDGDSVIVTRTGGSNE